jgi:hypothetical protein
MFQLCGVVFIEYGVVMHQTTEAISTSAPQYFKTSIPPLLHVPVHRQIESVLDRTMLLPSHSSHLLIHIFLILSTSFVHSINTVSIRTEAGYLNERICAQNCIWHVGGKGDLIAFLGCSNTNGWLNDCYCGADMQSSAYYFITSCVNNACSSSTTDLSGASSVYSSYCLHAVGAVVPAATTVGGNPAANTVLVVTTVVSVSGASRILDPTLSSIFTSTPPGNEFLIRAAFVVLAVITCG